MAESNCLLSLVCIQSSRSSTGQNCATMWIRDALIPWCPTSARLSSFPWSTLLAFYSSHFRPSSDTPAPCSQHVCLASCFTEKNGSFPDENSLTLWSQGYNLTSSGSPLPSSPPFYCGKQKERNMPHPLANVPLPLGALGSISSSLLGISFSWFSRLSPVFSFPPSSRAPFSCITYA